MSNGFEHAIATVGKDIEKGVVAVGHSVKEVAVWVPKLIKALEDGQKDAPAVKAGVEKLISDGKVLVAEVAPLIAERGMVLTTDIADFPIVFAQIKTVIADLATLFPLLEADGKAVAADIA